MFTNRSWKRFQPAAALVSNGLKFGVLVGTVLIFCQLLLGATMRHQHAGLAIPDFPLAYGKVWPATDADALLRYNQQRVDLSGANTITAFQIELQMAHRILAVFIFAAVAIFTTLAVRRFSWREPFSKISIFWLGLILTQVILGAWTVLSQKAADVATLHVLVGALSLATGALVCIFLFRSPDPVPGTPVSIGNAAGGSLSAG
jgi:cytochrome c oxidase assembly protein subunit 15